jgi:hypothetical protein
METLNMRRAGKVLISILVIFMLSWLTLLSSCTATIRTPRHAGSTVIIENQVPGERHNSNARQERRDRRKEARQERHE